MRVAPVSAPLKLHLDAVLATSAASSSGVERKYWIRRLEADHVRSLPVRKDAKGRYAGKRPLSAT